MSPHKRLRELTGRSRDIAQLKGFWRRTKLTAKKNVSEHKRAIQSTGGGLRPPSPSQEDLIIMSWHIEDTVHNNELEFVNEIITVADVHNPEVQIKTQLDEDNLDKQKMKVKTNKIKVYSDDDKTKHCKNKYVYPSYLSVYYVVPFSGASC
ncbi:unnamed protein product [Colias eurytheme]|nr:unnamed protein product [Colias eurytheme]